VEISNLLKLGEEYIYKQNKIRGLYPARWTIPTERQPIVGEI
jgi:hypothetical protein